MLSWIPAYMKHTFTYYLASLSYSFCGLQPQHLWVGGYPNFTGIISVSLHHSSIRLTLSSSLFLRGGSRDLDCISDFPKGRGHLCIRAIICTKAPTLLNSMLESSCLSIYSMEKTRRMILGSVQAGHVEVSSKSFLTH